MVDAGRITEEFRRLVSFDAPSYEEREIAGYLKKKLKSLGLSITEDAAAKELRKEDQSRRNTASNIYAKLPGTKVGEPVLFSAHLDTVSPGIGKKAIVRPDGTITSAGDTVLGADDVSGLTAILEALTVIREQNLPHPDIEILLTVAEEPYCSGSRFIEYERLTAKRGYVLDLTGPVGTAAIKAPSILSVEAVVKGQAAHAGFEPEKGINALTITATALTKIRTGRVRKDLTVNFGTIQGGTGKNIVPAEVITRGEIRSTNGRLALTEAERIRKVFREAAESYHGTVQVFITEHVRAYSVPKQTKTVRMYRKAVSEALRCTTPECIVTYGGSEANRLNEHGIETIVVACGMQNCHSTQESTTVEDLTRAASIVLALMTQ